MTPASSLASWTDKSRVSGAHIDASACEACVVDRKTPTPLTPTPGGPLPQRRWHRWLGVQPIPDIHAVYAFFDKVAVHGVAVQVLSWPSTRYHLFWPRPLKLLLPALNHIVMIGGLLRTKPRQPIVVREFDSFWFLLVAAPFWFVRRRLVLNVNQNFACPVGQGPRARAFRLLSRIGFRFLWLDGGAALADIRAHYPRLTVATPLFPVTKHYSSTGDPRPNTPFTVGLVGYFRADKGGVAKAAALAQKLSTIPGVQVAAGFWNDDQRDEFRRAAGAHIETCCTYDAADYHAFLDRCHAVVIVAERDAYYYRHSGILMDCIAHGTLPICPAYPVFESIVMRPVPVGAVYRPSENLRCVVWRVLAQYDRLRANFAVHAAVRNAGEVAAALEDMQPAERRAGSRAAIAVK